MKRIVNSIETTELCSYGCGNLAKFINGSSKLMCCKSSNSCPEIRKKNSEGVKNCGRDYVETYKNLPQETKDRMNWAKGLTKESHPSVGKMANSNKGKKPFLGKKHNDNTRKIIAEKRSAWLKNSENRKNLGTHKRSWMESIFEKYLIDNQITGWDTEVHFWNSDLKKNYYPDFIFENRKLIIELDGTQHRKTVEKDSIRDRWFSTKGYNVVRITHEEFKRRYFSGQGFLDLLGH